VHAQARQLPTSATIVTAVTFARPKCLDAPITSTMLSGACSTAVSMSFPSGQFAAQCSTSFTSLKCRLLATVELHFPLHSIPDIAAFQARISRGRFPCEKELTKPMPAPADPVWPPPVPAQDHEVSLRRVRNPDCGQLFRPIATSQPFGVRLSVLTRFPPFKHQLALSPAGISPVWPAAVQRVSRWPPLVTASMSHGGPSFLTSV